MKSLDFLKVSGRGEPEYCREGDAKPRNAQEGCFFSRAAHPVFNFRLFKIRGGDMMNLIIG